MQLRKLTLAALLPLVGAAASVSIQLDNGDFKVVGWAASAEPASGWESVFTVTTGEGVPPIFGSYSVVGSTLIFHPRFPLAPVVVYHATFHSADTKVTAEFHGPPPGVTAPSTHVVAMYPTAPTLPSNQLKLYLAFSAPMQGGEIWSKIHLVDDTGAPAFLPFVQQELWNRDYTRLTLIFDPGRIKRGVKPNVDMGPVLVEGKKYTLTIDRDLKDGQGLPLTEPFRHEFSVGPAERRGIDLKLWRTSEPRELTTDALIISFDRPLDYALLGDVFSIPGVPGTATISPGETQWRFQPSQPWKPGGETLVIDMALEDLAGNRIGRPFDVDTMTSPVERITNTTTTLPIRVRWQPSSTDPDSHIR